MINISRIQNGWIVTAGAGFIGGDHPGWLCKDTAEVMERVSKWLTDSPPPTMPAGPTALSLVAEELGLPEKTIRGGMRRAFTEGADPILDEHHEAMGDQEEQEEPGG